MRQSMGYAWFAIVTKPNREAKANEELISFSLRTFFPRDRVRRIHKVRGSPVVRWVERPHFSRYIFTQCAPTRLWLAKRCKSVADIVRFGDEAAVIPDEIMRVLMAGADLTGLMGSKDEVARKRFQAAQQVKFTQGAFRGMFATVALDDGAELIRVVMTILGAPREIKVAAEDLVAV